jgi:hypothetical protein
MGSTIIDTFVTECLLYCKILVRWNHNIPNNSYAETSRLMDKEEEFKKLFCRLCAYPDTGYIADEITKYEYPLNEFITMLDDCAKRLREIHKRRQKLIVGMFIINARKKLIVQKEILGNILNYATYGYYSIKIDK